jgi:pyridoxal phosphate enzyme (YggS family)
MENIAANLKSIRAKIGQAQLIAVSKGQDAEKIKMALDAGQRHFGENRVQEAQAKWPALKKQYPDIVLHLIGPLQTNKVEDALALFDVIHTIDREKLAQKIVASKPRANQKFLLQVNTGHEIQKAGLRPEDVLDFARSLQTQLPLCGLMCIPPVDQDPAPHFRMLAELAQKASLAELSMGMSGDYELAAQMGATMVRVGTAIFGKR